VRYTPTLTFELDGVMENAQQIEGLLAIAKEKDAEVAAKAIGAEHAGDVNPYKEDETDDEDGDEPEAGHPAP
jgi:ribosome-binding factor A